MVTVSQELSPSNTAVTSGQSHTPGPWRVFLTEDGSRLVGIGDANGEGIADCGFGMWRGGDAEAIANAHLIAAAPELLEALKEARDLLLERIHGNPARSAGHNARLVIEAAISSAKPIADRGPGTPPKPPIAKAQPQPERS